MRKPLKPWSNPSGTSTWPPHIAVSLKHTPERQSILKRILHRHQTVGPLRLRCTTRGPCEEGGRQDICRWGRRHRHKNPAASGRENGEWGSQVGSVPSSQAPKNDYKDILGEAATPTPPPGERTKDNRHAGTVGSQDTSGVTTLTKWRTRNDRRSESEWKPEQRDDGGGKGTQHPRCIGLEQPGDHVNWRPSAAGQNGPPAGSVGASVIVEGNANRDATRNTSLKRMLNQKHKTKKKLWRKQRVQHSCPLVIRSACEDCHNNLHDDEQRGGKNVWWLSTQEQQWLSLDWLSLQRCPRESHLWSSRQHQRRPSPSWRKLLWHWPWSGSHWKLGCLSPIAPTCSS